MAVNIGTVVALANGIATKVAGANFIGFEYRSTEATTTTFAIKFLLNNAEVEYLMTVPNGVAGTNGIDGQDGTNITDANFVGDDLVFTLSDSNLITLTNAKLDLKGDRGEQGIQGLKGADGKEIELTKDTTYIKWRYVGGSAWNNLVALADLKGDSGNGTSVDLSDYALKSWVSEQIAGIVLETGNVVFRDIAEGEIFTVIEKDLPIVSYGEIVLSKTSTTIVEGGTDTFTISLDKSPTNNQIITLSKDNSDVALNPTSLTFSPSNYNAPQTVTITVAEDNLDYSNETCVITCSSPNVTTKILNINITDNDIAQTNIPVISVALDKTTHTFKVGETVQLTPTITPSDATNQSVTWSTNNGNCTVIGGLVTGVVEGGCVITCTTVDGGKTTTCNVTVENVEQEITPTSGYVTDNLSLMYDLTKYDNGYNGDVIDSVSNITAIVKGQSGYTTGRNGFVDGKFMINKHKTESSTLSIPNHSTWNSYPFSFEFYGNLRGVYNEYSLDGVLAFNSSVNFTTVNQGLLFSTREGGVSGNGVWCGVIPTGVGVNGTISLPDFITNRTIDISGYNSDGTFNNSDATNSTEHHIIFSLDSNVQRIFVDGVLVSNTANTSTTLTNVNRELKVLSSKLFGDVKLIRVYKKIFTESEALQNYNDVIKTMVGGE